MTGIVAEAACTRVGSIQVIVQEVTLEFEHELQRQRRVNRIESCVEDADAHTITRWSPYECPRGRKLRELVAQVPGELLAGRPVRARSARFTDPAAKSEHFGRLRRPFVYEALQEIRLDELNRRGRSR